MMILRLLFTLLLTLGLTAPAWATTYRVATTGNDTTGTGTSASPWLTIQKCIDSVVGPGDICSVGNGTYTGPATVGLIRSTRPNGLVSNPITIKSTNFLGAHVVLAGDIGAVYGFRFQRSYWVVEGFEISGGTSTTGNFAVSIESGTGNVLRKNTIHGIATGVCSSNTNGFGGVYLPSSPRSTLIEENVIHTIGRLRTGESGCAAGQNANDHGIYLEATTGVTIRRNVFYNDHRGWPIHAYKSGATTTTDLFIYHNTFANKSPLGASGAAGHIILQTQTLTNISIKNNISYDGYIGFIQCNNVTTATSVSIDYNLSDTAIKTANCIAGITFGGNNAVSTSPGFVNGPGNDFTIASGSAAINTGVALSGYAANGLPDKGAFETFNCNASHTVNENLLDSTCGMNLNTPVSASATGMTALVGAVARTTISTSRLTGTDSVLRTTFNGAVCVVTVETWTSTYVPGTITDSALIGGTLNQKALGHTAQAVTNNCGTAPPAPPPGLHIHYLLDDNTGTNANDATANNLDGTLSGTFAWIVGKLGFGFLLTDVTAGSLAIPYGNAVNPSTQSLTVAFWVNVPAALTSAARNYFGHAGVSSNRFYVSTDSSTWRLGIQSSSDASGASNLAVTAGWNRVCLSSSSTSDIASLSINGTVGTGSASKAFTSYVFPSNLTLGSPFGASINPGVTYDDFKLWTSAESCADDWAAAEPPPPPSSIVLTQKRHAFFESHYLPGTTTTVAIGAQQAAITVGVGESFALVTQTDATVAGGSIGQRLHYSRNGSATKQPVTDSCDTADQICFVGVQTDPTDLLAGTVTCCLTGALTPIDGSTQITKDAVPVTPFTAGSSTVHRRILKLGVSAVETDTYDFFEYNQTGEVFGTYDPVGGARVTVEGGISAPTNLHFSGPVNSSLAALLWSPVVHSALAGYHIYRSLTSGVFETVPTYTVTVAASIAAHSPPTQRLMVLPVAGTYYFVTKAFDVDGNLSAATSEVSLTVTGPSGRTPRQ